MKEGIFAGKLYIFVLILCFLIALLILLIAYICYTSASKRRKEKELKSKTRVGDSIIKYDTLRFVYNTTVETQQNNFPLEASKLDVGLKVPSRESVSSPSELDESDYELLKNVDLVQPPIEIQELHSKPQEGSGVFSDTSSHKKTSLKSERFSRLRDVGLGKLSVSLFYNKSLQTLRINIIQWNNSGTAPLKHAVSPYVMVSMNADNNLKFFTKTKGKENPVFDEEFSFPVGHKEVKQQSILFSVCDFDKFSRKTVVGNAVIELEDFLEALTLPEGTGELWVNLLEPSETASVNKGELSYSLQYFPTTARITLTLVQAKGLNVEEEDVSISVKVSLLFGRKIAKTNKIAYHQSDMRNPTFNESCVFDIPTDLLGETNFRLCVYAYSEKQKRMIGKTMMGRQTSSSNSALTHWNEMLSQPRTPVLHWHKLV